LAKNKIDVVVHTAGITNVEFCEKNPQYVYNVNSVLSENIAIASQSLHISLIHISTDHLFSGNNLLVNEEQEICPLNEYASSKAEAERLVLKNCKDVLIIRTNFYGWGPNYRQSFSDFLLSSLKNGENLYLFTDVFFTPIIIERLVNVTHLLLKNGEKGIFNVVGDERISKYTFGKKLARFFGLNLNLIKPINFADKEGLVQRPLDMSMSNNKVSTALNFNLGGLEEHFEIMKKQVSFEKYILGD
jgi:dTDP-4-dehydrorhamnose reductase